MGFQVAIGMAGFVSLLRRIDSRPSPPYGGYGGSLMQVCAAGTTVACIRLVGLAKSTCADTQSLCSTCEPEIGAEASWSAGPLSLRPNT